MTLVEMNKNTVAALIAEDPLISQQQLTETMGMSCYFVNKNVFVRTYVVDNICTFFQTAVV